MKRHKDKDGVSAKLFRWRARTEQIEHKPNKRVDVILQRSAWICQIAVVVAAIFGYIYTVRPIYQKQLLDEAIARKELELKSIGEALDKTYINARTLMVRGYISHAGAKCSGLLDPPLKAGQEPPTTPVRYMRILKLDIAKCLKDVLDEDITLKDLRGYDYAFFTKKVAEIGAKLMEEQKQATREHDGVIDRARLNPESIPEPTGMRARLIDLQAKLYADLNRSIVSGFASGSKFAPQESIEQQRWGLAIQIERERVVQKFEAKIRNEVLSLHGLNWSKTN